MNDYIVALFKKLDEVPEVSRGSNLLYQLQSCSKSDRPISVIHHTMEALEQALHKWQECYDQQILALVEDQQKLCEKTVQLSINNQRFSTAFSSHLRNLHLSMIPKHDHSAYVIAKEGCDMFERKMKAVVTKSASAPAPTPALSQSPAPAPAPVPTPAPTTTVASRQAKNLRVQRLLQMDIKPSGSKVNLTISERSVRKRRREAVVTLNNVVKRMKSLSSATGVPMTKSREISDDERTWVIQCIKSIPAKWNAKEQKSVQPRKLIGAMYKHCWDKLMKQEYPPNLQSPTALRQFVSRFNASARRQQGHWRRFLFIVCAKVH